MDNIERNLPIGTVVLLKGATKELMITCYCIAPTGEIFQNGTKTMAKDGEIFEYGACKYPEGIIRSEIVYGFNHDQIEKVCHLGYQTELSDELSKVLDKAVDIYRKDVDDAHAREAAEAEAKATAN